MATMKEKIWFNFNGVNSSEFNLMHISTSNGMYEEDFASEREIREQSVNGGNPIFNGFDLTPKEFELNLAYEGVFTDRLLDETIRWLYVDYYKPLYFIGAENKIYYCMPISKPKITHNGMQEGYITIQFRCNSAYAYSPVYLSDKFVCESSLSLTLENTGHTDVYPEISILKNGLGDVTVRNSTNNGISFTLKNLMDKEDLYIDSEKEIIVSDIESIGQNRYNSFKGTHLSLVYGVNNIEVTGNCTIQFRYKSKYLF